MQSESPVVPGIGGIVDAFLIGGPLAVGRRQGQQILEPSQAQWLRDEWLGMMRGLMDQSYGARQENAYQNEEACCGWQ
jgi:hypothetical protein